MGPGVATPLMYTLQSVNLQCILGRHCRFVIVGPRVVVYRLSSSQVDGYTTGWYRGVGLSRVRVRRLTTGIRQYSDLSCCWLNDPTQERQPVLRAQRAGADCARLV